MSGTHVLRAMCALLAIVVLAAIHTSPARSQATQLPAAETCFQALTPTSGGPNNTGTGFVGLLGTITGGSGGTAGTYGGVALTGGSGTGATANITVSGGAVTAVAILSPGAQYVVGDVLSAAAGSIGNTTGFSVPVSSVYINQSLSGGTVGMYVPGTLTVKQTWQNAGQTVLNSNPIQLDANGCAIIYGTGIYRQILQDSLGNTIWDQLTTAPNQVSPYWAGLASGTGNAITVSDPSFSATDGQAIQFIAFASNTGPATLNPSGYGNVPIVKNSNNGPVALTGNEIVAGASQNNIVSVVYSATYGEFFLLNPQDTNQTFLTLEQFGGGPGVGVDNTPAWNAALAQCGGLKGQPGILQILNGRYNFNTKPNPIISQCRIQGYSYGQSSLIRNYNDASNAGFINLRDASSLDVSIRDIGIIAGANTSGGYLIYGISSNTNAGGFNTFENLYLTYECSSGNSGCGTVGITMYFNGLPNQQSGSQGYRDVHINNVFLFNSCALTSSCTGGVNSLQLTNNVNFMVTSVWANAPVYITGGGTALSNSTTGIINGIFDGSIIIDNSTFINASGSAGGVFIEATASETFWSGPTSSVTNLSTAGTSLVGVPFISSSTPGPNSYTWQGDGTLEEWISNTVGTVSTAFGLPLAFPSIIMVATCTSTTTPPVAVSADLTHSNNTQLSVVAASPNTTFNCFVKGR